METPVILKMGEKVRCLGCGFSAFLDKDLTALGSIIGGVIHLRCPHCRASMLAYPCEETAKSGDHLFLITDCTADDAKRMKGGISEDDVLDAHLLLLEETPGRDFIDDVLDKI